ncbi:hypothetical protein E2C01_056977 [Portunus trituberculatus]|uniref:Uncharacterized protein n=1 Tax=Portunus trituberculatus TaxID=210409 RepID=A0A5B7H0L1_PORTR|nr:hypothetical protein [Portunus trituberculatus]
MDPHDQYLNWQHTSVQNCFNFYLKKTRTFSIFPVIRCVTHSVTTTTTTTTTTTITLATINAQIHQGQASPLVPFTHRLPRFASLVQFSVSATTDTGGE